jgi:DNA polymerase-1
MAPRERTIHLIDGSAQVHRAYFAIRGLSTSRGLPTGAVYGFTTMLRKLLADEEPGWIGICFDPPGRTARHQEYKDYKANRRKMDDALAVQVPYVRRVCEAFRLAVVEIAGVEADDVIASLSRQAVERGWRVVVVSADKDLLQLVGDQVVVLNPGREGSGAVLYDRRTVEERFGVPPEQVVDVLALMGDAVDNVPGVPGIGDKGARELVREYGSLEAVLESAGNLKRAAYREGLLRHEEAALLSKRLVTLRADVPVALDLDGLARRPPDRAAVYALCKELEFQVLARDFAPEPAALPTSCAVLGTAQELAALAAEARAAGRVGLSLALTAREPMRARLLGIGLSAGEGRAAYLPLGHTPLEVPEPVPPEALREHLLPLLLDPSVEKVSARGKQDLIVLGRRGLGLAGPRFDVVVAGYLLNPGRRSLSVEELASEHLELRLRPLSGVLTGEAGEASLGAASAAASQEADLMLRLAGPLRRRLEEEGLGDVFVSMEMPLTAVLAAMEEAGVRVSLGFLGELSREMDAQIAQLTRRIHELAGGEFNVNSPPQLREVLFDRLGLRAGRRTAKTRAASTAEEVLEELARGHELPRKMLEYRGVQKLKSTYVDALPALVNPETGRIHASFNQTVAATGRLSVADPNLQNIPIRTAEGRRIREAFVPEAGHLLLSADYSQVELRILAHLCKDPILIDTFRRGEDVHDRTAREVFGPLSALPADEQRRQAKMINYALLYGKTAFSLARDIGASKRDAEEFIRAYFARYPDVRRFIDETLKAARETGVVRTLLGRLRRLPELRSPNFQVRMEAERQAVNTPVQGSAADLIKKAMIELHAELARRRLRSRLILQIHDELLLEVPEAEAEEARALVREVMEGALHLDVPLLVEARLGASWAEVH